MIETNRHSLFFPLTRVSMGRAVINKDVVVVNTFKMIQVI
jgi:hypothetical protein